MLQLTTIAALPGSGGGTLSAFGRAEVGKARPEPKEVPGSDYTASGVTTCGWLWRLSKEKFGPNAKFIKIVDMTVDHLMKAKTSALKQTPTTKRDGITAAAWVGIFNDELAKRAVKSATNGLLDMVEGFARPTFTERLEAAKKLGLTPT